MKRFICLSVLCSFLSVLSVVAKDIRTVTFKVVQIECNNCKNKVLNQVKYEKGLKSIDVDVPTKTVVITYDAEKTSIEKLKASFDKIKYYNIKVISDVEGKPEEKK